MKKLGITHAYDLRSRPEIERAKTAGYGQVTEWEGCQRVFVPVFRNDDYSPEGVALRYKAYASSGTEVSLKSMSGAMQVKYGSHS